MKITVSGQGPNLVFIHGWGSTSAMLADFSALFSDHFRVHLFDLPGYGDNANMPFQIETIAAHLPDKFHCIAWSMGGAIATKIETLQPERLRSLTTIAYNPKFIADASWPGMTMPVFEAFREDVINKGLKRFLALQCQGLSELKKYRLELKNRLHQKPLPSTTSLLDGLAFLKKSDERQALASLSCPQQHIYGCSDTIVPRSIASHVANYVPEANIIKLDDASHIPFLSHAAILKKHIGEFLGESIELI